MAAVAAPSAAALLAAWEQGAGQPPLERALTLLAAVDPSATPDALATLPIGERDARLLALRSATFGDAVEAAADCPACRERLELAFALADVRPPEAPAPPTPFTLTGGDYTVDARPPTSADIAAVEGLEPEAAHAALIDRCILAAYRGEMVIALGELPADMLAAVVERMAEVDAQAEIELALTCPACSHAWTALFDIAAFLWGELDGWARRTLRDVHVLASAYGWSEAAILGLSAPRRRRYLDLVQV